MNGAVASSSVLSLFMIIVVQYINILYVEIIQFLVQHKSYLASTIHSSILFFLFPNFILVAHITLCAPLVIDTHGGHVTILRHW